MENLINKDEEENSDDSRSSPTEFIKNESVDMEEDDSDMSDGIVVEERGDGEDADRSDDRLVESFLDSSYEEPKVKLESDLLVENIEFPSLPNPVQIKKKEKSKKELEEEEREKMQVLVSNFTEDQLNHYEMFRRSAFPRAAIKRVQMELSQDNSLSLLECYQNHPILWNPKDEFYYNSIRKEDAWIDIANLMQMSVGECRKKIEILKGSYRREKSRIKKRIATGQGNEAACKSKWFAFNAMAFLDEKTDPRETVNSVPSEEPESLIEEPESTASVSTPQIFKIPNGPPLPKRIKVERLDEEAFEDLRKAPEPEISDEECTSFGLYVANKLKKYTEHERSVAQHGISKVFFDIDMAKYSNYYEAPLNQQYPSNSDNLNQANHPNLA